jgi:hypothetical protein
LQWMISPHCWTKCRFDLKISRLFI